jgi:lysophospholipase L1-like esterase
VTLYARALARATGRPVRVENLAVPGSTSADLRAEVAGDDSLSRADAVLVSTGHNDPEAARTQDNVDAVLSKIARLRHGRPTLVRVTNVYDDATNTPALVRRLSTALCGAARQHHVPCADIQGVELASDHVHPSPRGHRAIARALERLGFSPLVGPGSP